MAWGCCTFESVAFYLFSLIASNPACADDPDNLKALYRRGQAFLGNKQYKAAVSDLERSLKLSASDPSQAALIRGKLQEAKDGVSAMRAAGTLQRESGGVRHVSSALMLLRSR